MQESFNVGQRGSQNCANVPHSLMTRELFLLQDSCPHQCRVACSSLPPSRCLVEVPSNVTAALSAPAVRNHYTLQFRQLFHFKHWKFKYKFHLYNLFHLIKLTLNTRNPTHLHPTSVMMLKNVIKIRTFRYENGGNKCIVDIDQTSI